MHSRHKHAMIVAAVAGSLFLTGAVSGQGPSAGPSAATPATPNPSAAAPIQQTPIPAPAASIPAPSSSASNPSASAPSQAPGSTTTMQNPNLAGSPIQMPSAVPSKAETASSAFEKLAQSGSTFVTKEESGKIVGFDRAFSEADRDRDGKLSKDEFTTAWAIYTGRT